MFEIYIFGLLIGGLFLVSRVLLRQLTLLVGELTQDKAKVMWVVG